MKRQVRRYRSFDEDFAQTKNQAYRLPEDYRWLRTEWYYRLWSAFLYGLAIVFSTVYCRLVLHVRFRNRRAFKKAGKSGFFLYGNHTQPVGDVFDPALAVLPKRIYTLASPANLGIPVLGGLLPPLGALPLPATLSGMKALNAAIAAHIARGRCIMIYPEAHVWEYYTGIRPFPATSFKYPVRLGVPAFAATVTYRKRRFCRRPTATIYIDGPFTADPTLPARAQSEALCAAVRQAMLRRAAESDFEKIIYLKAEERATT